MAKFYVNEWVMYRGEVGRLIHGRILIVNKISKTAILRLMNQSELEVKIEELIHGSVVPSLTQKQQFVYEQIKKIQPVRPLKLGEACGFSECAYIYPQIRALIQKGYIDKIGKGKNTFLQSKFN